MNQINYTDMGLGYTVHPLFDSGSSTWTYILVDKNTGQSVIIDPVLEKKERDLAFLNEMNFTLQAVIETHVHADHITAAYELRRETNAQLIYGAANREIDTADRFLDDGEVLKIGALNIQTITTPGHTAGCTSFYIDGTVFTGDTLFIRGCGRTDFQGGSAATLYDSVHTKLFKLSDQTIVRPAHDYKGMVSSTIGEEKQHNSRLKTENTKEQFIEIMDNLDLPYPKMMDVAVPANLQSGRQTEADSEM